MLIIEDGTAKVDAQSYASVAELVAFATARSIVIPATEGEQETLLLSAIDYMETLRYIGQRYSRAQALSWPRTNVSLDGFRIDYSDLPRQLKAAQIQLAIDSQENELMGTSAAGNDRVVIEETVEGAVSVKYAVPTGPVAALGTVGVTPAGVTLTRARSLLRPLLAGTAQVAVGRA